MDSLFPSWSYSLDDDVVNWHIEKNKKSIDITDALFNKGKFKVEYKNTLVFTWRRKEKAKKTTSDPTLKTTGRKGNKMTEENKKMLILKKSLYYISQYANDMGIEQFVNRIDWMIKEYELDGDLFVEIALILCLISDAINEIFDLR